MQGRALARPALLRRGRVVALEPLRRRALKPVIGPLAYHQVAMRVLAGAGVQRQRVGQVLRVGQMVGKAHRQLLPLAGVQGERQGKFQALEQPPVGPLVQVGRVPVGRRRGGRPPRHVARFGIHQLLGLVPPAVLGRALDVGSGRPGAVSL